MSAITRVAGDADLVFLDEVDPHVAHDELSQVVAGGRVLVAESDGERVGCLRWGLFWDSVPFMNYLFVVPERRGQGLGAALVTAWEDAQLSAGRTWVLTSTMSHERSQHFYRRLGYVDTGALLLPDEPAELFLRKSLG